MEKMALSETDALIGDISRGGDPPKRINWRRIFAYVVGFICFIGFAGGFSWLVMGVRVPEIAPLTRVAQIDPHLALQRGGKHRLIFVGDVHGMHKEFKRLLRKMRFDETSDKLILLGDFITKGPDSLQMVEDAIRYNAYCVRGNHEDEILRLYAEYHHLEAPKTYPPHASAATVVAGQSTTASSATATLAPTAPPTRLDAESDLGRDWPLVKHLKPHHMRYIEQCPAILSVGQVSKKGIEAVAVHGGLMWNTHELEEQDVWAVLRVRSVVGENYDIPTEEAGVGKNWFDLWNDEQLTRPKNERYEVLYGHDASKGLQMHRYSKGLDTRCQRGNKLSGLVVSVDEEGHFHEKLYQVQC